jgi:hypothetical protein
VFFLIVFLRSYLCVFLLFLFLFVSFHPFAFYLVLCVVCLSIFARYRQFIGKSGRVTMKMLNYESMTSTTTVDVYWYRRHDIFNLLVIPFIILSNLLFLFFPGSNFYFWNEFCCFIFYLVIDTFWLILRPRSVPSPKVIILHHLICFVGFTVPVVPYRELFMSIVAVFSEGIFVASAMKTISSHQEQFQSQYRYWISLPLLVEVNTWFFIARRNAKERKIVSFFFYISWIVCRLILYPLLLWQFSIFLHEEASLNREVLAFAGRNDSRYAKHGSVVLSFPEAVFFVSPCGLLLWCLMFTLIMLNCKWTNDIFWKLLTKGDKEIQEKKGL